MNAIDSIKYYGFSREAKVFLENIFKQILVGNPQSIFELVASESKSLINELQLEVNTIAELTNKDRPLNVVCVGVNNPSFLLRQDPLALAQFVRHRYSITPQYDFESNTLTIPSSFLTFASPDLIICSITTLLAKAFFVGAEVSPNPDALALVFCVRLLNLMGGIRDFIYEFCANNALAQLDEDPEREATNFASFKDIVPNPNINVPYPQNSLLQAKSKYNLVSELPQYSPIDILSGLSKSAFTIENLPFTENDSYVVAYIDSSSPITIKILRRFNGVDQRLSLIEGWAVLATHKAYID